MAMGHYRFLEIKFLFVIFTFYYCNRVNAHDNWSAHVDDMMAVFGFQEDKNLKTWMKFISSDMIDKPNPFYKELCKRHPGFSCNHRLLFHWGYNAEPWNRDLEERIKKYCDDYDLNLESNLRIFKSELKTEQKRRNRILNKKTEDLFGFAHGGREASYANFFCSMAYNTHLLGDYMSDNSEKYLKGLMPINNLIGTIVADIQSLDKSTSKSIISGITHINKIYPNQQKKADALMAYLQLHLPTFIKQAQKGSIKRRLEGRGFRFK